MAVEAKIEKITPAEARRLLESNHVNRRAKDTSIAAWRRDMEAGRWHVTGEAVKISRTGSLLDGQNRLKALAGAKVRHVEFLVVRGLPDEAQRYMDSGTTRSLSDALVLQYGPIASLAVTASVTRWLTQAPQIIPELATAMRQKTSVAAGLETFGRDPEGIRRAGQEGARLRNTLAQVSPTAYGYTWYHLHAVDNEACAQFFWGMTEMNFQGDRDPRKAALRRLIAMAELRSDVITQAGVVSVMTRAWNAWRKGEEMGAINHLGPRGLVAPVRPV